VMERAVEGIANTVKRMASEESGPTTASEERSEGPMTGYFSLPIGSASGSAHSAEAQLRGRLLASRAGQRYDRPLAGGAASSIVRAFGAGLASVLRAW